MHTLPLIGSNLINPIADKTQSLLYFLLYNKDLYLLPAQLSEGIDLQQLMVNMKDTTDTLYAPNRYVELSLEEIMTIQSKGESKFAIEEVQGE